MHTPSIVRDQSRQLSPKQSSLISLLTICILLVLSRGSGFAQLSQRFAPTIPPTYAAGGTNPNIIGLADMNGDGHPDLLVATKSGSKLSISYLPGNGKGVFGAPHTAISLPATDTYPVAFGDFNHDGHLDLVVMTSGGQVVMLLGNAYGTFAAQPAVSCPKCNSFQVGTGDFNKDGELDLVFSGSNQTLVVLLGIGNGKFKTPVVTTGIADAGQGLVVGDFNGDGILDVVTTDGEGDFETAQGYGNGKFFVKSSFSEGVGEIGPLSAADFRNDGKLDLVWTDPLITAIDGCGNTGLWVAKGNGDGSFQAPQMEPTGFYPGWSLIGDVNGDGKPDIVAVNYASPSISVLLNNGAGEFKPPLIFRIPPMGSTFFPFDVLPANNAIAADLNGDGKTDLVLSLSNGAAILLAQSAGSFHAPNSLELFSIPVAPPSAPVDVNHDGIPDILTLTNEDDCQQEDDVTQGALPVLSRNGVALASLGDYDPAEFFNVYSIGTGDFNRDGNVDFALIGNQVPPNNIEIDLNNGSGTFTPPNFSFQSTSAKIFAVGDFNHDGFSDLALLVGNTVQIRLGHGGNNFGPSTSYAVGDNPVAITVRDVNGDGKQDLVVVNQGSDTVSVLLGNGNGTFAAQKVFAAGTSPVAVTFADFNRDGKVDLAVADKNEVAVLLGNGNGTFGAVKTYAAATDLLSIAAVDLRQNGLADVLAGASNGNLVLLSGLGNGTLAAPQQYAAGGAWFLDVADFNGDGAPDVVLPGPYGYAVTVLYNQGGTRVTLTSSATTIVVGASVKFTAKVAATVSGAGTPAGSVAFYDGTKSIGTGTLTDEIATFTTSKLSQGTHTIRAFYSGSTNFNNQESAPVTVMVKP